MTALYVPLRLFSALKFPALEHLLQTTQLSPLPRSHPCLMPFLLVIHFYPSLIFPHLFLIQALSYATTAVICTPLLFVPRIAIPWHSPALTDLVLLLFGPEMPVSATGNKLPNFLLQTFLNLKCKKKSVEYMYE